jgi:hypothetical protein
MTSALAVVAWPGTARSGHPFSCAMRLHHTTAVPAMWVLNGTNGEWIRYVRFSTEVNPADRITVSRSRSHEHPSNTHAHGRRTTR